MKATVLICLLAVGLSALPAQAFEIVDESVTYNPDTGKYSFVIYFDIVPDFWTIQEIHGGTYPHHSFAYYIDFDERQPNWPEGLEGHINAAEICSTGTLTLRDGQSQWPTGSWYGNLISPIEYKFNEELRRITFSFPSALLGRDGIFYYDLILATWGSFSDGANGPVIIERSRKVSVQETTWGQLKELYR